MKGFLKIIGIALVAALVSYGVAQKVGGSAIATKETAFERVMNSGVLRCAYYVYPPMMIRDINSGALSGLAVDVMSAIAAKTGLKVEWVEEVSFGNWVEGLQVGRYDAVCTPNWPDAAQGRVALFTRPLFFAGVVPIVRSDDNRFVTLADMNKPEVVFAAQDNDALSGLVREVFPRATVQQVPPSMDWPTVMHGIVGKKIDAVLGDRNNVREFNSTNGNALKMLFADTPVKAQSFALVTGQPEHALRDFLDNAVDDLLATGTIDRILAKWEPEPGFYLRVAPLYRAQP